ncbi:hypothetical protein F4553_007015 [Allocatelliglobosispora scoriae]|uniref:Choice-of-anchor D domain-containing protein n=1 Tax=Allocatelliglobosispora scoriae TaxID=643052 RepID=A0A841C426_9ACTN|nr:hypothetical protein [Allocatelliglobosispora scoriae]MBB5873581.1 hypothetical protein [Allocatelliglobosispora scoriae]
MTKLRAAIVSTAVLLAVLGSAPAPAAAAVVPDVTSIDFGTGTLGQAGSPRTVTMTADGPLPSQMDQASITDPGSDVPLSFSISADTCSGTTLAVGGTCTVTILPRAAATGAQGAYLLLTEVGGEETWIELTLTGVAGVTGTYRQITPTRILDTRFGIGAPKAPIGPGGTLGLPVLGRGGVPGDSVSAVVLNVTVTGPTSAGFVTVFPHGVIRPYASSLNFPAGWTGANSVTVGIGTDGKVDFFNSAGSTGVIADVMGYYLTATGDGAGAGEFFPTVPQRVLDTRSEPGYRLGGQESIYVPLSFGVDNRRIKAFAVTITAVSPLAAGYLTAWSGANGPIPGTSTLNFTTGTTVANMAIVPTSICLFHGGCIDKAMIGIYNGSAKGVHVLVDLVGVYDDGTLGGGLRFQPQTPTRIVDTRVGIGSGPFGPGFTRTLSASPVAIYNTVALAANVTAIVPSAATFLTLWPALDGVGRPGVSNLNPAAGQTVANAAVVQIGPTEEFKVFNQAGLIDIAIDVVGTFFDPSAGQQGSLRRSLAPVRVDRP